MKCWYVEVNAFLGVFFYIKKKSSLFALIGLGLDLKQIKILVTLYELCGLQLRAQAVCGNVYKNHKQHQNPR